jgi:hypothetical protein
MFTERLSRETRQLGLPVIEVDTALTEEALEGAGGGSVRAREGAADRMTAGGGQPDRRRQQEDGPNG